MFDVQISDSEFPAFILPSLRPAASHFTSSSFCLLPVEAAVDGLAPAEGRV